MTRVRRILGRIVRWTCLGALAGVLALAVAVYGFPYDASRLDPGAGGPLVVTDKDGNVLRALPSADGRRDAWVSLDDVPAPVVLAVLASEDERFYRHSGVDAAGVLRAGWLNLRSGRVAYGGSTITMQLVRMVHSAGEARSVWNKIKEAVIALRLERAMSKKDILEQYLNRAYYANGAYGIEAAAQTYFGKPAVALSVGEATLLAVVPRAPSAYDPMRHLDAALRRRDHVFGQLAGAGLLGADEIARAQAEPISPALHPPPFRAPHFVDWVVAELPPDVRARGGVVRTTLDLGLQEALEHRVADHVGSLARKNLDEGGVVVLDTQTGAVRAMVGSADFFDVGGQLNIATRRRHPGSALKPFVYALAIEGGDSPASIAYDILDVPSEYRATKATQPEHGPVRYREALAGSYNLAAVHVLEHVGVEKLVTVLRAAGLSVDGSPADYGLRMALGSVRVRLIDLAAAYGFLARSGRVTRPRSTIDVTAGGGRSWRPPEPADRQLFSAATSYLVMDMLADADARHPVFGRELPLDDMGFDVAAKTGTSRGFSDTVAVAVTRELTVAAWAGNFDGTPTQGLVAMRSAAPLVRAGMMLAAEDRELSLPERPDGVVEADVCALSGLRPTDACPHRKHELFTSGRVPTKPCDWHRWDGRSVRIAYPESAAKWARRRGFTNSSPKEIFGPVTDGVAGNDVTTRIN